MQPKVIDNPSHCERFKQLLANKDWVTINEFKQAGKALSPSEKRNLNRKLNKLAQFGFIEKRIKYSRLYNETECCINYVILANTFWKFICEAFPQFEEKSQLQPIAQKQLIDFVKFYIQRSWVKEEKTIRAMFLRILTHSYGVYTEKKPFIEYKNFKGTHGMIELLMTTIGFYSLKEKLKQINP